jgi:hypothetical protein
MEELALPARRSPQAGARLIYERSTEGMAGKESSAWWLNLVKEAGTVWHFARVGTQPNRAHSSYPTMVQCTAYQKVDVRMANREHWRCYVPCPASLPFTKVSANPMPSKRSTHPEQFPRRPHERRHRWHVDKATEAMVNSPFVYGHNLC